MPSRSRRPGVRGLPPGAGCGAHVPRGLRVLGGRASSHPSLQLSGPPFPGLCTGLSGKESGCVTWLDTAPTACKWTPQLPLSLLTPPSSLGTGPGGVGPSAPLPLIPALTRLVPPLAYVRVPFLTPRFPHPLLSSSPSSCSVIPPQGCCTGREMWFLFLFSESSGAVSFSCLCPPSLSWVSYLPRPSPPHDSFLSSIKFPGPGERDRVLTRNLKAGSWSVGRTAWSIRHAYERGRIGVGARGV